MFQQEHAITYTGEMPEDTLSFLVKKANCLGLVGREVIRVYKEKEDEKVHLMFEVTPMIPRNNG